MQRRTNVLHDKTLKERLNRPNGSPLPTTIMTMQTNVQPASSGKHFSVADARRYLAEQQMVATAPSPTTAPVSPIQQTPSAVATQSQPSALPSLVPITPVAVVKVAAETPLPPEQDVDEGISHSFSHTLAVEHGIPAALLARYFAYRVKRSQKVHEGFRWTYETIRELADRYPYLGATTIHDAIRQLKDHYVVRAGCFNKWPGDKTCWYAFQSKAALESAEHSLRYFDPTHANEYGIPAALLLQNIEYWVAENRKKNPAYRWHPVSPAKMEKLLPLSKSTIVRALKLLVEAKVLRLNPHPATKIPEYALEPAFETTVSTPNTTVSNPNMTLSIPNMTVSEPNTTVSNPNVTVSNPNNYTYYRDTIVDPVVERPVRKRPERSTVTRGLRRSRRPSVAVLPVFPRKPERINCLNQHLLPRLRRPNRRSLEQITRKLPSW